MPFLGLDFSAFTGVRATGSHRVYLRERWIDDWQLAENLWCDRAAWALAPGMPTAQLSWRYGFGRRQQEAFFRRVSRRPEPLRYYVKIVFDTQAVIEDDPQTPLRWYGTWEARGDRAGGEFKRLVEGVPAWVASGNEALICFGLEFLLERAVILDAVWQPNYLRTPHLARAKRGLTFNANGEPNRNQYTLDGVYRFADMGDADYWDSRSAVEHLVKFHSPRDWTETLNPWRLTAKDRIPDWDRPVVATHNRTVRSVLNELIPTSRLLSYRIDVEEREAGVGDDLIKITPISMADQTLDLEDGKQLLKNDDTVWIQANMRDYSQSVDFTVQTTTVQAYDQVILRGARWRSCFSISYADQTLVPGYSTAEKDAYDEAASLQAGYPAAAEIRDRELLDAIARAEDAARRAYVRFQLPNNWDGRVKDGLGAGTAFTVFPRPGEIDPDGHPYGRELAILPTIPLLEAHDYSGTKIAGGGVVAAGDPPFAELPPQVFLRIPSQSRYVNLEKAGQAAELEDLSDGDNWSLSGTVMAVPNSRALEIRLHGQPQHALAATDFVPLTDDADRGLVDWQDMIVTIAVEDDLHCEARYPPDNELRAFDFPRRLVIDVGDEFRVDRVHAQTVVGLRPDGTLLRSTGGLARDDEPLLRQKVRIAYDWYRRTRSIVTLGTSLVTAHLRVGQMLSLLRTDVTWEVWSVISHMEITIPAGEGKVGPAKIEYQTAFGEFDPLQL